MATGLALALLSLPQAGTGQTLMPAVTVLRASEPTGTLTVPDTAQATAACSNVDAQTATTYEIGTRGKRSGLSCDVSLYRASLRHELPGLTTVPWSPCTIILPAAR